MRGENSEMYHLKKVPLNEAIPFVYRSQDRRILSLAEDPKLWMGHDAKLWLDKPVIGISEADAQQVMGDAQDYQIPGTFWFLDEEGVLRADSDRSIRLCLSGDTVILKDNDEDVLKFREAEPEV